ncbi:MAG: chemotaxis protein CheB [Gammaproteobacteria bacterium]|nr:chemotaxis protein CheB [Gammaproteobacteria bacterium]
MDNLKNTCLVIGSGSKNVQQYLSDHLSNCGANIILCGCIDKHFIEQIEGNALIDVILVIVNDNYEEDEIAFDRLLDNDHIPILFYDHRFDEILDSNKEYGFSQLTIKKLTKKLQILSQDTHKVIVEQSINTQELNTKKSSVKKENNLKDDRKNSLKIPFLSKKMVSDTHTKILQSKVKNVWVLGASLGGPDAIKQFLEHIPAGLPVAFVLAQHLGDGFIGLFASQLDRTSSFTVKEGLDGEQLQHGEVALVPVDRQMTIDINGKIKLLDDAWQGHYHPSINAVIKNVTHTFKKQSGVIIFTGMGEDGSLACQEFFKLNTHNIWAQSKESCMMSSMPDAIRKTNIVTYSGSPEALALKMVAKYKTP